jgi:hypothetical protein
MKQSALAVTNDKMFSMKRVYLDSLQVCMVMLS